MKPTTAWITGAAGLIGRQLVRRAAPDAAGWRIIPLTRDDLDLLDTRAVEARFRADRPHWVIHGAGLTRSPVCQADPTLARRVNVDVTAHLAGLAAETGATLIFFSTDLVFDGRQGNYTETDPVNPLSVYGETKAEAERRVLAHPGQVVVRTSLNYGFSAAGDRAFNEELVRAWEAGRSVRLFTDEYRCPIAAEVTARSVWQLTNAMAAGEPSIRRTGIFHLAGSERLSRWQIGECLAARYPELHPRLEPGSLRDYQGAPRAPDTSLNCSRIQAILDFPLPGFRAWLAAQSPDER